jgi:hypothetical protein
MRLVLFLALFLPQTAVPINPSEVAFLSPDHAIVTEYEVGFFLATAIQPVQTARFPKGALGSDGEVHLTINSRPLALGSYTLKVRAIADATVGEWSQPAPFSRALSMLGAPRIVR